jgi:hypothetical protein
VTQEPFTDLSVSFDSATALEYVWSPVLAAAPHMHRKLCVTMQAKCNGQLESHV